MSEIPVRFVYMTGLTGRIFLSARLVGSWDAEGRYSDEWTSAKMSESFGDDGCPCFTATVLFDDSGTGRSFFWGVEVEGSDGVFRWGIPTEVKDNRSDSRHREFVLREPGGDGAQEERYYLTYLRRLGANKVYRTRRARAGLRFAVWAPNAENVEVVFGRRDTGYISDDGTGIDPQIPPIPMTRGEGGVWETGEHHPGGVLRDFSRFDHRPYMYRITKRGGRVAYRTDLYSRCQIGSGVFDPNGGHYDGSIEGLDGSVSCSVVIDPDLVARNFSEPTWPESEFEKASVFWRREFNRARPVPSRIEDLVIYELHIGAIWNPDVRPGTLGDAIGLLDYLQELGVNAVELLPMNEYEGWASWGYGTSHYMAIEYSCGGRDQFKHFVRECHRRGIAVILDVVYNHYHHYAERAEWAYDSDDPGENIYYWYEGRPEDYPGDYPQGHGGYIDNMSTGYAPRYHEEMVRNMFISSAAALVREYHVDGFRVDQTTSIHLYNVRHADGAPAGNVNGFGAKFLRELTYTLKLISPTAMLIAEDHSEWDKVTRPWSEGGLGFDASWYSEFYHHLIGDSDRGQSYARLLHKAGMGGDGALAMDYFAGALGWSGHNKVVYHESHDEAGNSDCSQRTIVTAVNGAPLIGETRKYAENRSRFVAGAAMLAPGTPLFLMGEEIGARKRYKHDTFLSNRENLRAERADIGANMFSFYRDLIGLRLGHPGLRSHDIDIVHVHNGNRVLAFRRWDQSEELLVVCNLGNRTYDRGYRIDADRLDGGAWTEIFNSDSSAYGGDNVGNMGATIAPSGGGLEVVLPANGFVVLRKS
jgi:1,4-alpha-glucan branching enzyme